MKAGPSCLNLWFDGPYTLYEPAPEPLLSMYKNRAEGDDRIYRSDEMAGRAN